MVIRERRQREVARREQHILDAAQRLIRDEGLANLQMSRLAEVSEYAVGTLYLHFARKEDLLLSLSTRNDRMRIEFFERAAAWKGPTRERMLAIALADMLVLEIHPESFPLAQFVCSEVVWNAVSPERRQQAQAMSARIERIVTGITDAAIVRGDLPGTPSLSPLEVTLGLWTQCLGMHNLVHFDGSPCAAGLERPDVLLFKHLNHLLNGYGWRPLMTIIDDETVDAQMQRLSAEIFGRPRTAGARRIPIPESEQRMEASP